MVQTSPTRRLSEETAPPRPGRGPIDWLGGWWTGLWTPVALLGIAFALRIYQQPFAWKYGIDAGSADFKKYWWSVLFIGLIE